MTYEEFTQRYTFNTETDLLGEGGFGEVFKAYDNYLDKWVAIKQSKVKKGMENFTLQKEVELATKLPVHPNIAHYEECHRFNIPMMGTYDFGVLQYYEEGNLSKLRKTGKINAKNLNDILEGILNGLHHLHSHKIIHRDIKPGNILIANRGTEFIPKITDFGISKQGAATDNSFISNSLAGGTFSYAAPEQLKGQAKMRRNADLWSFGVILYELMTNKLPFEATTLDKSSEAARNEVTSLILEGTLPEDIEVIERPYREIIIYCLEVNPGERIKSAAQLLELLKGRPAEEVEMKTGPSETSQASGPQAETTKVKPDTAQINKENSSERNPVPTAQEVGKKKKNKLIPISMVSIIAIAIAVVFYFIGFNRENTDWEKAQQSHSVSSYENYIQQYPDGQHTVQANESIDWLGAEKQNSQIAYQSFIEQHPQGKFTENAKNKLENIVYQNSVDKNTPEAFRSFIKEYPDSKNMPDINQKLNNWINDSIQQANLLAADFQAWGNAKKQNTKAAYQSYINQYPAGKYLKLAITKINSIDDTDAWEKAKKKKSKAAYEQYLADYPKGQYASQSKQAIKDIANRPKSKHGSLYDERDGKTYKTIKIGSQTWMAENLNYKTTNSWTYDNDPVNGDTYGRLYTWYAALTACPKGWHLPSDDEWKTMEKALGMSQSEADKFGYRGTDEGKKIKSTSGWFDNGNGTNSSGFNALPGGYRGGTGSFYSLGGSGYWWSSGEGSGATGRGLAYDDGQVLRYSNTEARGFSVRCLKD